MKTILAAGVLCALGGAAVPARGADIVGAMTAQYLLQCQKDQNACREFTNEVLQVFKTAVELHQATVYKACAPWPLTLDDTGKLVQKILDRPQDVTGYAADDIAIAAGALWPCK